MMAGMESERRGLSITAGLHFPLRQCVSTSLSIGHYPSYRDCRPAGGGELLIISGVK